MAMLGAGDLTEAYYDKTLNGKRIRDVESKEMLDIIFASAVYDIGIYYKVGNLSTSVMTMAKTIGIYQL